MDSVVPKVSSNPTDPAKRYDLLPDVIDGYTKDIDLAEDRIKVSGKTIEQANVENAAWANYYDLKATELKKLNKYFMLEIDRVRSKLYRKFKENHSRELGEREIQTYINAEDAYLIVKSLQLEVEELYDKYRTIVDAFTTRGYALNNITKLRVAEIEGIVL